MFSHRTRPERQSRFLLFDTRPGERSLRGVWMLLAIFFASLVAAAIAAPIVYNGLRFAHALTGWDSLRLEDKSAAKIFDALRTAAIVPALPWLLRTCRSNPPFRLPLGLVPLRDWGLGFSAGLALIAAIVALHLAFAPIVLAPVAGWPQRLAQKFAIGWFTGVFEETIFRVFMLGIIYTAVRSPVAALVWTSVIYAWLHFRAPNLIWVATGQAMDWSTGWALAGWSLTGVAVEFDLPLFFILFMLGMLLGALRLQSRTLWPVIGLHTGVVMGFLIYKDGQVVDAGGANAFWGTARLTDSWAVAAALAVCLAALSLWPRRVDAGTA